jgi:hypothetical protein
MSDPDAMEVNMNVVDNNMTCFSNLPAVQFGEGGTPNIVGGRGVGECRFDNPLPNPAPEAGGGGVNEPITVRAASLGRYTGTHTQTANQSAVFGTTSSGDTLVGEQNTVVLGGNGLTGTVSERVLSTVHPNGSSIFTVLDTCTCTFAGHSGTVIIRAYGTSAVDGFTHGTFIVTGGTGGLATLAGHGTFSSAGQPQATLQVVEHLRIA